MSQSSQSAGREYTLKIMTPQLVSDNWCRWLNDSAIMRQINSKPFKTTRQQLVSYLVAMQAQRTGIVGIFHAPTKTHVGIYEIKLDELHRVANISVLIDFKSHDINTVFNQTESLLLTELARRFGSQKATMVVPQSFMQFLTVPEKSGWDHEGTMQSELANASDGKQRLNAHYYGKIIAVLHPA
jgi:hypothetical protein